MPFTMEFPDTVYKPQFDVTTHVTITQPYKKEQCIYVAARFSSHPSGKTIGYCYFNTRDKVIYVRGDTDSEWTTIEPVYREDGCIYYVATLNAFAEWNGRTLVEIYSSTTVAQAWNHVYINTTSFTTAPTGQPSIGDWYFNSTDHQLYYYNLYSWVAFGTPVTTIYNYATALYYNDSRLWRYNSSDMTMRPYYGMVSFGIDGETPSVYRSGIGSTIEFDYTFTYPDTDASKRYTMSLHWYDEYGSGSQWLPEEGVTYEEGIIPYTIQGRNGSISTTLTWLSSLSTYPTTDDEFSGYLLCSPDSSNTASILVLLDTSSLQSSEVYGVTWLLSKTGGEGGSFSSLSLSDAVSLGYVILTTTYNESSYNWSKRSFRVKYAGDYTLTASYKYRDSSLVINIQTKSLSFRVYSKSAPVIEISTSTTPSPDPDVYPPPYTVVLCDKTASSNAYQIPQQTITMDAEDSDNPESWTLENTGTTIITMPDKTHVYSGYGQYRPSLTIVDKNGNTSVAYAQFAPSKTARTYTPSGWSSPVRLGYNSTYYYGNTSSTVSVSCGNAPVLLTAEAGVAGDPLPDVTWTYSLSGGTYTGETTGEYAELSLLYAGTYSVTCTIKNGTTTLATYTWSVTVQSELVSSEADKTMPDFGLIVCNGTTPIDYCKSHICPQYTSRWQDSDTVQFELPVNYQYAPYLQEGDIFIFGYQGAKPFIVSYRQQSRDSITITGTAVFPERVAITATRSTANDGYDVQKAPAEALVRYFVHTSLTDPYSTAQPRTANFMIHGTCQDYPTGGDDVTYSARYERVQDIINEICETSGIGYYVGVRNMSDGSIDKYQMWIKEGTDRTYSSGGSNAVIFSDDLKNMSIESDQSALYSNVAIGAGEGTGNYREYSYYDEDGSTPTATGFERREVFVDAGDATDSDEIKRMSVLELKTAKQLSIKIRVLPSCQWVFGTDYNVGDTVTLIHPQRGQMDLQIFSAEYVRRQTGDELYLNLGSRSLTAPRLINRVASANTYSRK